jgi:hypothetical protein
MINSWTIASVVLKVIATLYTVHGLVVLAIAFRGRSMGVTEALITVAIILGIGGALWIVALLLDRRSNRPTNPPHSA